MDPIEPTCRGVAAPRAALIVSLLLAGPALALFPPACAKGGNSGEGGSTGTTTLWTTSSGGHGGHAGTGGTGGTSTGGSGGTGAEGGTGGTSTGGTGGTSTGGTGGTSTGGTGGTGGTSTGGSGGTGAEGGTGGTGGSGGGPLAYSHTITIDGNNDFTPGTEAFQTSSSPSYTAYVTWDATYLYVGMNGPDVGSSNGTRLLLIYIGGAPGTTTGFTYNTQTPTLPFTARWHIHWAAANNNTVAYQYNGATWQDASWDFTGDVHETGNYVEMRIPRSDIGNPSTVALHVSMVNTTNLSEWSYAAAPSTSFVDSYDPSYAHYFAFDLTAAAAPNTYAAQ